MHSGLLSCSSSRYMRCQHMSLCVNQGIVIDRFQLQSLHIFIFSIARNCNLVDFPHAVYPATGANSGKWNFKWCCRAVQQYCQGEYSCSIVRNTWRLLLHQCYSYWGQQHIVVALLLVLLVCQPHWVCCYRSYVGHNAYASCLQQCHLSRSISLSSFAFHTLAVHSFALSTFAVRSFVLCTFTLPSFRLCNVEVRSFTSGTVTMLAFAWRPIALRAVPLCTWYSCSIFRAFALHAVPWRCFRCVLSRCDFFVFFHIALYFVLSRFGFLWSFCRMENCTVWSCITFWSNICDECTLFCIVSVGNQYSLPMLAL